MKKRISLLLAVVMVLGSFASVFASDVELTPYEAEAANFLYENEILVGNTAGLLLGEELIRQDSVILLSRLLGEEDEATSHAIADSIKKFTDLPNDNYYKRNISWAVENEYYQGTSNTTFSPKRALRVEEYATILVRALGYGEADWKKSYDKAEELGLLANVNVEGPKQDILRKDVAVMTFNALKTNVKGSNKTLAEELGIVLPEEDVKIKALSSKEIEVEFEKALTKDEQAKVKFVVKDENGKELALSPVAWDKEGKKAVIQRNYGLTFRDGDYTVEVKGEGINAKETLTITRSKAQKLEIKENVVSSDAKNLELTINVVDQYGAKTKATDVTVAAKNLTTGVTLEVTNNEVALKDKEDGKSLVKEGDIISVTALDKGTTLSTTKKIEVVAGSVVDELAMGDVVIVQDNKVVDAFVKGEEEGAVAYVEVIALDQYGKKVDLGDVTKDKDKIKFFATGLKDKVIELKDLNLVEGKDKKFLDDESEYIKLIDGDIKDDVNEVSIYGVIVRSTGVENSNVVKFDVVSAGGAVEFKLAGKYNSVLTPGGSETVELKFYDKLGREVKDGEVDIEIKVDDKVLDKEATKYEKGKVTVVAKDLTNLPKETEVTVTLKVDGEKVQSETLEFIVIDDVKGYKVEVKDVEEKEFTAGDEVELVITALKGEGEESEVNKSYSGTQALTITVNNEKTKHFRDAKFSEGVATVKVPLMKAQAKDNLTIKIEGLEPKVEIKETVTNVTVKAGKVEKFVYNNDDKVIYAVDKYNNLNTDYNKTEIVKDAKLEGKAKLDELDSEGNFKAEFKDGKMTLKFEPVEDGQTVNAKLTLTIDGIKTVINSNDEVEVNDVKAPETAEK